MALLSTDAPAVLAPMLRENRRGNAKVLAGLRYEKRACRAISRWFPGLVTGRWIRYADVNGLGWASPDAFKELEDRILLFETKLSQTVRAESQLLELYSPLLFHIFRKPVVSIQVCRNLYSRPVKMVHGPEDVLTAASNVMWTWHLSL